METIEQRLKDATEACLKAYGGWDKNKKDSGARESLMEAVHELRKVAARLEIDIAISERDEMASKPIPIPPHRSNKRKPEDADMDDSAGNRDMQPPQQHQGGHGPGPSRGHGGGGPGGRSGGGMRRKSYGGGGDSQGE